MTKFKSVGTDNGAASTSSPAKRVAGIGRPFTLTDRTFDEEVRKPGLLLAEFWAGWCGPCHRIGPILEELARDRAAILRVGRLNVDDHPRSAERFQVMSIPTMLLFKDGSLVDGIVGAAPRPQIEAMLTRWT
jgi:thioredoxin 1